LDKKENKKIILICPSIGDELNILDYLKKSVNFNFRFILSPHPTFKKNIIKKYLHELRDKCYIEVHDDVSTFDLISISDLVICGSSIVAYEALFLNGKSIKIINSEDPPILDLRDKLPSVTSSKKLKKILNSDSFPKTNSTTIKRIKRNYFYRLDNKAYLRFWNFVKSQNL